MSTPLPDLDEGPRNFITTDSDHGGVAITISTLMATWCILCFIVRVYMRMTVSGPFGVDDVLCSIATAFGVVQMIVSCVGISFGFGKALALLTPENIVKAEKCIYVAQLLYIVTNTLTKCCVALLLARIVFIKGRLHACYGVLVAAVLWGIASFLAEAIRCTGHAPWAYVSERCPNYLVGWDAIAAFNILIELALFALPIWLVWDLQTNLRRKITVVTVFGLRLPVIAAIILRIYFLNGAVNSSEPLLTGVIPFICLNVEMFYGLMAATMPTLKPFVGAFNTGWGTYDTTGSGGYGMRSHNSSYAMKSIENGSQRRGLASLGGSRTDRSANRDDDTGLRPVYGKNVTQVQSTSLKPHHDPMRSSTSSSAESRQMIIRQTLTCEVHFEEEEQQRHENKSQAETADSIDYAPAPAQS